MVYVWFVAGLVVLVVGAELLVRGAVVLAAAARISSLVIGLTVVAFGTSAPELAVSAISSLKGDAAIALGNVVGSNIFNVLFILGLSAIIVPLTVTSQLVRLDVPLMIAASCAAWLAAVDGAIDAWEAALMFVAFVTYTIWLIRMGENETESSSKAAVNLRSQTIGISRIWGHLALVVVGLALLVLGARWLVAASIEIAQTFGVSDMIIGLTIVAAGTSLPELATSIVAALKGERDIAVGNVVGSNVFNLLAVLASASLVSKSGVEVNGTVLWFDLLFMVWVALLCWPMFKSHGMLSRAAVLSEAH
jgi:cation:H+ antiporter